MYILLSTKKSYTFLLFESVWFYPKMAFRNFACIFVYTARAGFIVFDVSVGPINACMRTYHIWISAHMCDIYLCIYNIYMHM